MGVLKGRLDAFGREMMDAHSGRPAFEIVERDDGHIMAAGTARYFAPCAKWPRQERAAIRYARGRCLDVGCGAGRVALYLQEKGLEVVGIDVSTLVIKVAKARGVRKARLVSVTEFRTKPAAFDTVILFGNNSGLLENKKRARWLLRRFYRMTSSKGRILAGARDPYQTESRVHRAYHARNRRRGRMAGQLRLRVRYLQYATPWFDWLLLSKNEMAGIVEATGWRIKRFLDSGGSAYAAVLEKD